MTTRRPVGWTRTCLALASATLAALGLAACTASGSSPGHAGSSAPTAAASTSFPAQSAAPQPRWTPSGSNLVAWSDPTKVSHLFYHSLIVDPRRAFASKMAVGYRDYMVTVTEFRRELDQLYARGYVLVHPERLAAVGPDGTMRATPLMLPPGRKPLVLSIDDVSYYDYMTGDGFASDLFFTPEGRLANHYTDASGTVHVGSYDVAPIVDDFVREHPDFSYDGDKGSIALTGYNGALGYRSSIRTYGDTPATRTAIAEATAVATAMRTDGWNFASHSWGHIDFTKDSLAKIRADTATWDAEVRPIVGRTPEFIFPFGADISGVTPYSERNAKYHFLHDVEGYDYFFPIDATKPAWGQLAAGSLRQARVNVDGISLTRASTRPGNVLWDFFDRAGALDPARTAMPTTRGSRLGHGAVTGG